MRITGTFRSQRPPGLATPEAQAEVELGQEHEIRPCPLHELERLAPPRRAEDVEAVVAQLASEVLARLELWLGDEDGARHAADASLRVQPAPDVLSAKR